LPNGKQETKTPWTSYAEALDMFGKIVPGKTSLAQLKILGFDPDTTPNVALLGHADLLRRLVAGSTFDISALDPALRVCASAHQRCYGFEIEQLACRPQAVWRLLARFFELRPENGCIGLAVRCARGPEPGLGHL